MLKFLAEFETSSILPVEIFGEPEFSIYKGYLEEEDKYIKLFGSVTSGQIIVGQNMLIGPDLSGEFKEVEVIAIKHLELQSGDAMKGQNCQVNIKFKDENEWNDLSSELYRKGTFLVDPEVQPVASWGFVLKINSFEAEGDVSSGFQPKIFSLNI